MLSFITSLGAGVVIGVLILGFGYLGGSLLFMFTDWVDSQVRKFKAHRVANTPALTSNAN